MDDLFWYFLAGMFGEELMRKIATKPYGFWLLWVICTILVNVLIFLFIFILGVMTVVKTGEDGSGEPFSISSFFYNFMNFSFVIIQPWEFIFSIVMGLVVAISYRISYRKKMKEQK